MKALLSLVLVGLGIFAFVEVFQLVEENRHLRAERVEWQRATMPALRARGWSHLFKMEELRPSGLKDALNPCRTSGGGMYTSPECMKAVMYFSSYGYQGIPIRIELGEGWPSS